MITGGSGTLGSALADAVERDLGAVVMTVDRRAAPSSDPGSRTHLVADLSTDRGLAEVIDAIQRWRPTVLVNGAALNQSLLVTETGDERTDELLRSNFTAPFVLMREMARLAQRRDTPTWVVNIVSPYRHLGVRTHSLYCATKAALSRAGESAGVEAGRTAPFTVVSVSPGTFISSFRPVEPHDAPLVRFVRGFSRTPDAVIDELIRRLRRGSRFPHRTVRLGWDGWLFEWLSHLVVSDWFLVVLDRLIGQRRPEPSAPGAAGDPPHTAGSLREPDHSGRP